MTLTITRCRARTSRIERAGQIHDAEDLQIPTFEPGLFVDHLDIPGTDGARVVHEDIDTLGFLCQPPRRFTRAQIRRVDGYLDSVAGHEFGRADSRSDSVRAAR